MSKDLLEKLKLAGCRCESFESQAAVIAMLEEALAEAKEEARDNVVAHVVAPPYLLVSDGTVFDFGGW